MTMPLSLYIKDYKMLIRMLAFIIFLYYDFKLAKAAQRWRIFYNQQINEQCRIFVYSPYRKGEESKNEFKKIVIYRTIPTIFAIVISHFIIGSYYNSIWYEIAVRLLFLIFVMMLTFTSFPERNKVLESKNLNIGYGAALWYYENYLRKIMPHIFLERVEQFISLNQVPVEKKLFILVPKSCKIPAYLDCDEDRIERCKELPEYKEAIAGIKDRIYNITVYEMENEPGNKWVRLAIEYAQPLKALYAMKEKHLITEDEMFNERMQFVWTMRERLKNDPNKSYQFCELVEYDDEEKKVSVILLEKCSLGKTYNEV